MKGTNYIDHRFQYGDMIRSAIVTQRGIGFIDIHGRLLYLIIPPFKDSIK